MRWSKIKNIIIVLLVIVNLSLLALVGLRAWQSERSQRELRQQMVAILEKSGVEYSPEDLPADLEQAGAITAPTALARFLEALSREGYVCSQVTAMYAGTTGAAQTPCWVIETDAWPWRFTVDAFTGQVTPGAEE